MKKILTMGFVALVTAATIAGSTVPASAGGGHGHGHHNRHNWHGSWNGGWNGGWRHNPWRAHVRWCSNRYHSYNPATNKFINSHGRWRTCYSPYI